MMRRGCRVHLLHFHSYPLVSMVSQEKVRQIAEVLTRHQLKTRLLLAPFGALQKRIILTVPPPLRVVIYRRLMFRIADRVAHQMRAGALVTGEVIGQVASQTLENLSVINDVTGMPVLRPLVGMDKDEITAEAQRIGTYPISVVPDEDCCQLFTPKHPSTKARRGEVEAAEAALPIEDLIAAAVAGIQTEELTFPAAGAIE
jgi:thiamine biosynthesis protein ThiI